MSAAEILLLAVKLAPEELALLDEMIHSVRDAFARGQTEEQAVDAARRASRDAVDMVANAEKGAK